MIDHCSPLIDGRTQWATPAGAPPYEGNTSMGDTETRSPARPRRPRKARPEPETLVAYYRQMLLIRRFEERAARAYTEAKIGGYCHLNIGEEATVTGLMAALEPRDYLFTNYREHGYALGRGIDARRVMAELYGRSTGVSK